MVLYSSFLVMFLFWPVKASLIDNEFQEEPTVCPSDPTLISSLGSMRGEHGLFNIQN